MRILVAGPPKTGNVWVDRLLSSAYGLEWLQGRPPGAAEFLEWARASFPDDAIIHQHYAPSPTLLGACDELSIDLVTTLRNPYDQFVSLYFYTQRFAGSFRGGENSARKMIGRPITDPAVLEYLRTGFRVSLDLGVQWLDSGRSSIVRYEDLAAAPEPTLLGLADALGPVSVESVRQAIEDARPERMRSMSKHVHAHIRSAKTGDWQNHLTNAHLEAMAEHGELIERLGYTVEPPRRTRQVTRVGARLARRARRRPSRPFIITGLEPGGAQHLRFLLDSHPDVRCYGELFDPDDAYYATSGLIDHHRYLAEFDPSETRSVTGFELSWTSVRAYPQILDLFHNRHQRVVRVNRDNLLERFVDAMLPSFSRYRLEVPADEAQTVRIDLDDCLATMHDWFVRDRILRELTRGTRVLDVEFDDLDDTATHTAVEHFLGISAAQLSSPMKRPADRPLPDVIENWDEVSDVLRDTPWERFLRD